MLKITVYFLKLREKNCIPCLYALDGEIVEIINTPKFILIFVSSFIFASIIFLSWSVSALKDTKP